MRVLIGVLTFRRSEGLRRLLYHLGRLELSVPGATIEILVVDNDPTGSAREIVLAEKASSQWPLHYVIEERRGISFGRNRCIEESLHRGFDVLAFIDDDEVPSDDWLSELLDAMVRYNADAVAGPVLPRFECPPPRWIVQGKFFESPRYPTGTLCKSAGTGNVAVRLKSILASGIRFDERLALSGGEDSLFFRSLTEAGCSLIWVNEAIVFEHVSEERMTVQWLLQRAFRVGTATSFRDRVLAPKLSTILIRFLKGLGRLIQGIALLPFAVTKGASGLVASARFISYGLGVLIGLFGVLRLEYADRFGDS